MLDVPTNLLHGFPIDLPAGQRVFALFMTKWAIGALRPIVQLKVSDPLADEPRTAAELAAATDSDADALSCVLRCVSASGVFAQLQNWNEYSADCLRPGGVLFDSTVLARGMPMNAEVLPLAL